MKDESYHMHDDLLVKYLLDESTDSEKSIVEQWIMADEDNRNYFDDFKLIWQQSKELAAVSTIDEDAAWHRFQGRIKQRAMQEAPVRRMSRIFWIKSAAIVVLVAGAGILALQVLKNKEPQMQVVQSLNQVIPDTLADGSIVTLNKQSTLTYPEKFEGNNRSISLQGEAFFQVTPDRSKPFIVQVNDVTVRVVGTSFNIKSRNGTTEVIVESGIVEVTRQNQRVALHPKDKLVVQTADTMFRKQPEGGTLYNYYRTREFKCDNTPLWKLVDILNEAYDAKIIISNEKIRNLPLTTTFNNESLDNILEVIRQTFKISVTRSGDTINLQ
ncbi:MAG TPA: FecR domain-containing protein [Flavitalea sp.]|nr:FecR domain-containing protein [Flavitalea sp.]